VRSSFGVLLWEISSHRDNLRTTVVPFFWGFQTRMAVRHSRLQVTKVMHAFASGGVDPRRAEPYRRDQPGGSLAHYFCDCQ
jgi:hypothetical protein